MNKIKVCVAGATGWAGSELSRVIFRCEDMELVAAISRSHPGKPLGEVIGSQGLTAPTFERADPAARFRQQRGAVCGWRAPGNSGSGQTGRAAAGFG